MSTDRQQSSHPSGSWLPGELDKLAALQVVLRRDAQLAFEKYWEELRKILPALVHADKSGFEPGSALDERTQLTFLAWARMFV